MSFTMADKTQQIAQQADYYADNYCNDVGNSYKDWSAIRDTHFAKLIAGQCFIAAMKESRGQMNPLFLSDNIKQHTGVSPEL